MRIIHLDEVDSTNSYLEREAGALADPVMVTARCQTAGRGQRGNTWESKPGENLTFSILFRPRSLHASCQFSISEAVALGVVDFLATNHIAAKVKWPNDIYVGDGKICGILIHNTLLGVDISDSVIGVGVNVNQTIFVSDAPNPVSMRQLSGNTFDLHKMEQSVAACILWRLDMVLSQCHRTILHEEFFRSLWRADGALYPFRDSASGSDFFASIADVDPSGVMTLLLPSGSRRSYGFKEVSFILNRQSPTAPTDIKPTL